MGRMLEMWRERYDNTTVLSLSGEVDLHVSAELRQALLDELAQNRDVLIDMKDVGYIDSSGVASMIEGFQRARKAGRRFALARVPESAMRVLRIAQLDRVFLLLNSVDPDFEGR
jgi:anti-sigma B factor antagonist